MGDFNEILSRVPPADRAGVQAWWNSLKTEAQRQYGLQDLARQYPAPATPQAQVPVAPSDVTAVRRPGFPMMAPPDATIGARDPQAPMIPFSAVPEPGVVGSGLYGFASALPGMDELAGAVNEGVASVRQGRMPTAEGYETLRRFAEYQMGRGADAHPEATFAGQTISTVGQILAMPGLTAEQMAAQGPGRAFLRNVGEGVGLGALYGGMAADPGVMNRLRGAGAGGFMGGVFGGGAAALGEIGGGLAGTAQGRRFRGIAEQGDTPLSEVRRLVDAAPPNAPLAGADVVGPQGPARLRAIATTPNEGQVPTRSFFQGRAANRPSRVENEFAAAAGKMGVENPVTRGRLMTADRQQEAQRLYDAALRPRGRVVILPSEKTAPLLRIRRIRELVDEFREIQAATAPPGAARKPVQTRAPGLERVTAEELHYVKRRLAELGEGAEPGGAAATQAVGRGANSVQGAVEQVLNGVPGYKEANAAYQRRSGLIEANATGSRALQMEPDQLQDALNQMSREERDQAFEALPSSVSKALESGTARGTLGKLGLGQAPRLGRQRSMDFFTQGRPGFEQRLDDLVAREEGYLPAERAATTEVFGSPTEPNRMGNLEAAASQGIFPTARRMAFRAFRGAPDAGELARDAEVLRATGDNLRRIVGEAEQANATRGQVRRGFNLGERLLATLGPTVGRTAEVADRARAEDEYWRLRAEGWTEEEAMKKARGQ